MFHHQRCRCIAPYTKPSQTDWSNPHMTSVTVVSLWLRQRCALADALAWNLISKHHQHLQKSMDVCSWKSLQQTFPRLKTNLSICHSKKLAKSHRILFSEFPMSKFPWTSSSTHSITRGTHETKSAYPTILWIQS